MSEQERKYQDEVLFQELSENDSNESENEFDEEEIRKRERISFEILMDETFDEEKYTTEQLLELYRNGFHFCAFKISDLQEVFEEIKKEMERKQREVDLLTLKEQKLMESFQKNEQLFT